MQRLATNLIITAIAAFVLIGCDAIMGGGQQQQQPQQQPYSPPGQPGQPGMQQPAALPGQPMPQPMAQPGMPAPGQPMPQPVAQPGMPAPGQPMPQPVAQPGMPTPLQPGMPGAMPPGAVAPTQQLTPPTPTGDPLTDGLNSKKFEVAANFSPTSAMVKQSLEKGKSQSYQVQLPGPPYCHTYITVGEEIMKNLDMSITSPTGNVEAADSTEEHIASIQNHCPTTPGAYKLMVSAPKGSGQFAIQVFSK